LTRRVLAQTITDSHKPSIGHFTFYKIESPCTHGYTVNMSHPETTPITFDRENSAGQETVVTFEDQSSGTEDLATQRRSEALDKAIESSPHLTALGVPLPAAGLGTLSRILGVEEARPILERLEQTRGRRSF
jgi:hypothetical protein